MHRPGQNVPFDDLAGIVKASKVLSVVQRNGAPLVIPAERAPSLGPYPVAPAPSPPGTYRDPPNAEMGGPLQVPPAIEAKIKALMDRNPEGIIGSQFLARFQEMHGHQLNYKSLGYSKLSGLFTASSSLHFIKNAHSGLVVPACSVGGDSTPQLPGETDGFCVGRERGACSVRGLSGVCPLNVLWPGILRALQGGVCCSGLKQKCNQARTVGVCR